MTSSCVPASSNSTRAGFIKSKQHEHSKISLFCWCHCSSHGDDCVRRLGVRAARQSCGAPHLSHGAGIRRLCGGIARQTGGMYPGRMAFAIASTAEAPFPFRQNALLHKGITKSCAHRNAACPDWKPGAKGLHPLENACSQTKTSRKLHPVAGMKSAGFFHG